MPQDLVMCLQPLWHSIRICAVSVAATGGRQDHHQPPIWRAFQSFCNDPSQQRAKVSGLEWAANRVRELLPRIPPHMDGIHCFETRITRKVNCLTNLLGE